MAKLAVLDKDGTLTRTISGSPFPEHPRDQRLIPGAEDRLKELRALGFTLSIASNQGGCAEFECEYSKLRSGMWIRLPLADGRSTDLYKIVSIGIKSEGFTCIALNKGRWNGKPYFYAPSTGTIQASYKSIDEAIEEMEFAMALTGISHAYFCPSAPESNGDLLISINAVGGQMEYSTYKIEQMIDLLGLSGCWLRGFRKPCGGMLQTIEGFAAGPIDRKIMIGDRPEDEGAAKAAGFEFQWAHEWISKGVCDAWWMKR